MARVITFHYSMSDSSGNLIYSSEGKEPLAFIEGIGQILPSLEAELGSMNQGDKKHLELAPEQAFGPHDVNKVLEVPREQLPPQEISMGDQFQAGPDNPPLTVTKLTDTHVTLDGNHPLAGVDLTFELELLDVREATEEELEHGHVHGAGGHHH